MNIQIAIKKALQKWANENDVTPANLADKSGMSYQQCWNILRGRFPVTDETLGRLFKTYGMDGPMVAISDAISKYRHNGAKRT